MSRKTFPAAPLWLRQARGRLWLLLCAPAALALYGLAHGVAGFAEGYARTVYPVLSKAVNFITGLLPFSLAEILLYLLVPGAVWWLTACVVKIVRCKNGRAGLVFRTAVTPFCAAALVFLCFMLTCGINYGRDTFTSVSGLQLQQSSPRTLEQLCDYLCTRANELRPQCAQDENGEFTLTRSVEETAAAAAENFSRLQSTYPTLQSGYSAPKAVLASRGMSYLNITGIFVPFTFEANVNTDVTDYNIPVTMCHELSHLRGYMREDEANFIGYLACLAGDDPDFLYSGTMLAFTHCINALYGVDTAATQRVYDQMDAAVLRDLQANNAYWKQFETPVADVSNAVNDAYLQSNGQSDGVQSYGRMVDLLLAYYSQTEPVL